MERCSVSVMVNKSVVSASYAQAYNLLFCADNHPAALYIYAFPPAQKDDIDQRVHPYLLGILMTSSAIILASWKPASGHSKSTLAFITSHSQSIHLWSHQAGQSCTQVVEAVPIPIGESFFCCSTSHAAHCYLTIRRLLSPRLCICTRWQQDAHYVSE
jgi:hypothetical protein